MRATIREYRHMSGRGSRTLVYRTLICCFKSESVHSILEAHADFPSIFLMLTRSTCRVGSSRMQSGSNTGTDLGSGYRFLNI